MNKICVVELTEETINKILPVGTDIKLLMDMTSCKKCGKIPLVYGDFVIFDVDNRANFAHLCQECYRNLITTSKNETL